MAIPNPLEPFLWGSGGQAMTPAQIARQREVAALLAKGVGDTSPVDHWLQGVPRLTNALGAGLRESRADAAEAKGQEEVSGLWQNLFGGGSSASPVAAALAGDGAPSTAAGAAAQMAGGGSPMKFGGTQQEFVDMLMPAAIEASKRTGIDPRIIIAQSAQETGWGKHAPGNNLFGVKSHGQPGGQVLKTHEYVDGKRVNVSDSFRTYGSPEESAAGYADFILANPRYKPLMAAQGLDAQLAALAESGYATDPGYAAAVGQIARSIQLPQLDQQTAAMGEAAPVQVASLDESIGMPTAAPAQLPPIDPPMAPGGVAEALAAPQDPMQTAGIYIPQPGEMAPPQPSAAPPAAAPAPMQTAQAPQYDMNALLGIATHPFASDAQKEIAMSLLGQQMEQQQMAADPMRQLELEKLGLEVEGMRNPPAAPPKFEVIGGELVSIDPNTNTATSLGQFGAPETTAAMQNYDFLVSQGLDPAAAIDKAFSSGTTVNVNGDGAPGLGKLSTDYGYVLDPATGQPRIDPDTGLPTAAPVPGSPAARDIEAAAAQTEARTTQSGRYADIVLEDIDRALGLTGGDTTGLLGALLQNAPGTNARNLDALLSTVRANVGFDRLQSMRDMSPTGGALGQVSEFENRLLQATLGNLEQSQTEDQLRYNLTRMRDTYLDIIHGPGNRPDDDNQSQASPDLDIDALLEKYQ